MRSVLRIGSLSLIPVGVAVYAFIASRRQLGGAVFLGLATMALVWLALAVIEATDGLLREPEAPREGSPVTGRWRKVLNREKQLVIKAIKELELDHEMGKISDADFAEISAGYRTRAVRVLRQLDESGGDYRALVEREIKRRTGKAAEPDAVVAAKAPAPAPTPVKDERPTCASCGTSNEPDAVFCKKCGKPVRPAEVAS